MKKLILSCLFILSNSTYASNFTTYVITESLFPSMIPIGSQLKLNEKLAELKSSLMGTEVSMSCEKAPSEILKQVQAMKPEVSNMLKCGDETMVLLMNDDTLMSYDQIATAELIQ